MSDVLDAWVEQNLRTWAPSSARDQQSRVRGIKTDPIARVPLVRLSVGDVERWHSRLRQAGRADAGIRNLHTVLRAARTQAVRWGWASTNVVSMARLRSSKTQQRTVMSVYLRREDDTVARDVSVVDLEVEDVRIGGSAGPSGVERLGDE